MIINFKMNNRVILLALLVFLISINEHNSEAKRGYPEVEVIEEKFENEKISEAVSKLTNKARQVKQSEEAGNNEKRKKSN